MRTSAFTLRAKLTGAFLLPTLIIILLYGLITYFASREGLEDELGKRLISVGNTLSSGMSDGFDAKQIQRLDSEKTRVIARLRDKLLSAREATGVRRIFLFDRNLNSLVDTSDEVAFGESLYALEADRVELERTFEDSFATTSVLFSGSDGQLYKTGYVPVTVDGEVVAALGIEGSAQYFELLTGFASVLTLLGAMGILLVLVVSTVVARRITRPVNELVAAARRLGAGEYDFEVVERHDDDTYHDELQFLGVAIDEMRLAILARDRQMMMMLSGIAHEVRNPLGGMKLFTGLLEEDLRQEGATDALDKVDRIQRELDYLDRVVTDFLDFAKASDVDHERFNALEFARDLQSLLAGECQGEGVVLDLDVDEDLEVTGDRGKLRRAVINCVRNAYQACEGQGHVTVAIEPLGEGAESRRIRIEDDGPGIPQGKLDEVLTPFFTTKEKGSGLGLSLTRRIIEDHGGEMTITSEEGKGTRVEFTLPFDASLSSEPAVPEGWLG